MGCNKVHTHYYIIKIKKHGFQIKAQLFNYVRLLLLNPVAAAIAAGCNELTVPVYKDY